MDQSFGILVENLIHSYREMKHAIPRETRAKLAKLLYELTVTPGMDTSLVEYWATVCVRLIRYLPFMASISALSFH